MLDNLVRFKRKERREEVRLEERASLKQIFSSFYFSTRWHRYKTSKSRMGEKDIITRVWCQDYTEDKKLSYRY